MNTPMWSMPPAGKHQSVLGDTATWDQHGMAVAPPVFGAELEASREDDEQMPTVFLPTAAVVHPDDLEMPMPLYDTGDGTALVVFSSLETLIEGCGEYQPWIACPADHLAYLQQTSKADVVVWDVALPNELRFTNDTR